MPLNKENETKTVTMLQSSGGTCVSEFNPTLYVMYKSYDEDEYFKTDYPEKFPVICVCVCVCVFGLV